MPTYEYACRDCGGHLEVVQSFSDAALTECPTCGGRLRKVFSAAGLIFKGSGWHIKDYAGSGPRSTTTSAPGSSTDGGTPSGAGSDAPGAASAPAKSGPVTGATPASAPAAPSSATGTSGSSD